jgi:hypothetical protein
MVNWPAWLGVTRLAKPITLAAMAAAMVLANGVVMAVSSEKRLALQLANPANDSP